MRSVFAARKDATADDLTAAQPTGPGECCTIPIGSAIMTRLNLNPVWAPGCQLTRSVQIVKKKNIILKIQKPSLVSLQHAQRLRNCAAEIQSAVASCSS